MSMKINIFSKKNMFILIDRLVLQIFTYKPYAAIKLIEKCQCKRNIQIFLMQCK